MMHNVTWEGQIEKLHEIANKVARGAYSPEIAKGDAAHTLGILSRIHAERIAAGDFTLYAR